MNRSDEDSVIRTEKIKGRTGLFTLERTIEWVLNEYNEIKSRIKEERLFEQQTIDDYEKAT